MAKKRNAPVLRNNNEPAEKFRTVNRMNGIVTMVEYSSEDDIKAYELEPTFRELTGGGSSDLSISEVTLVSSDGQNYTANITLSTGEEPDYCTGVQIDEYGYDTVNPIVDVTGESQTLNFIIMPNKYIFAMCNSVSDFTVTGNAEVVTATQGGMTVKYVKIYGTCSITLVP